MKAGNRIMVRDSYTSRGIITRYFIVKTYRLSIDTAYVTYLLVLCDSVTKYSRVDSKHLRY